MPATVNKLELAICDLYGCYTVKLIDSMIRAHGSLYCCDEHAQKSLYGDDNDL